MAYRNKISNIKYQISKRSSIFYIFLLIGLSYYLFTTISNSVFLKGRDKINVVFYGEKTNFYSLDRKNISYILSFSNLVRVIIPGGYGKYKIGAVGKLASLENEPEIIKKTFSAMTSSLVDLYFFQKKTEIYYSDSKPSFQPTFINIFFTKSNANFIDRLIIYNIFLSNNKGTFQVIDLNPFESGGSENEFDYSSFYKKFQGSFFQKSYRGSDINLQIFYKNSYKTAQLISQMIEGEGIRVVDLSGLEEDISDCLLISDEKTSTSKTYKRLADYFKCKTKIGETRVSDIILMLGDLEKEWAIN